jgi:hypothetical protein
MSNTISYSGTALNLSRVASSVLQSAQAPTAAICTAIDYRDPDLPGISSTVAIATAASATLQNPSNFESGDCTLTGITLNPVLYCQSFGLSGPDMQTGAQLDWLATINAVKFAETLNDAVWALLTTANFGAAVVSVDSAQFALSDFDTLWGGIPTVSKSVVLDTPYRVKVKNTWLPANWNACYEHSRWSAAGAKIRGFVADKRAIVLKHGPPFLYRDAPNILAREPLVVQPLGLQGEVAIWFNPATRSVRAAYSIYLGVGIGDANALKLLTSVS